MKISGMGGFIWEDPLESTRDLEGERLKGLNARTLAQCPALGIENSKSPPPVDRQDIKQRDRVTNPQSEFLN